MDEQSLNRMAAGFCGQLRNFITTLQSNTSQLKASITQKPPAYGDLSSFLLDFNDRLAEDGAQMDQLEEMIVENVSFEELLAHCSELYKQNESSIALLESQLGQFGYTKGENGAGGEEKEALDTPFVEGLKQRVRAKESSPKGSADIMDDLLGTPKAELFFPSSTSGRSYAQFETIRSTDPKSRLQSTLATYQSNLASFQSPLPSALAQSKLDSDDLSKLGESFSLEDFGISASSLASLSLAGGDPFIPEKFDSSEDQKQPVTSAEVLSEHCSDDMDESCDSSPPGSPTHKGSDQFVDEWITPESSFAFLRPVTNEYNQLQSWLRQRISLEELNEVVAKVNDAFHVKKKEIMESTNVNGKHLELEERFLLALGLNMKTGLFMLVQLDKLVLVSHDSCTYYRPSTLDKFC